jgi:hypothetical protein
VRNRKRLALVLTSAAVLILLMEVLPAAYSQYPSNTQGSASSGAVPGLQYWASVSCDNDLGAGCGTRGLNIVVGDVIIATATSGGKAKANTVTDSASDTFTNVSYCSTKVDTDGPTQTTYVAVPSAPMTGLSFGLDDVAKATDTILGVVVVYGLTSVDAAGSCGEASSGTAASASATASTTGDIYVGEWASALSNSPASCYGAAGSVAAVSDSIGLSAGTLCMVSQTFSSSGSNTIDGTWSSSTRGWSGAAIALKPSGPQYLNVTYANVGVSTTAMTVGWTNPPSTLNDTSYLATYSAGSCGAFGSKTSLGVATSHIFSGLTTGSYYCLRIGSWTASGTVNTTLVDTLAGAGTFNIVATITPPQTQICSATYYDGGIYITHNRIAGGNVIEGTAITGAWAAAGDSSCSTLVDPQNGYLYANGGREVQVFSGTTNLANIIVNGSMNISSTDDQSDWGAYDPADGYVYEPEYSNHSVAVISGTTLVDVIDIGVGSGQTYITNKTVWAVYDAGDGDIYVDDWANVTIINGTKIVGSVPVYGPTNVAGRGAYDPVNQDVYVPNGTANGVTVIHGMAQVASISGIHTDTYALYDPVNGYVYVLGNPIGTASGIGVISGTSLLTTIVTGHEGMFSGVVVPGDGYLYAFQGQKFPGSNYGNISIISGTSVIGDLYEGKGSQFGAYDPASGFVYTPDYFDDNVTVIGTQPPAPTDLQSTATTTSSVSLSWVNPGPDLWNDTVEYSTSSAGPWTYLSTGGEASSATISGLTSSTKYYFAVDASNATGGGPFSSNISAITQAPAPPHAPTGLSETGVTPTTISLSWTQSPGVVLNNTIEYATSCSGPFTHKSTSGPATSFTLTGLVHSTTYCIGAQSWNSTGGSSFSTTINVTTEGIVPGAPTSLSTPTQTSSSITLDWTNPSGGGLINNTVAYSTSASGPWTYLSTSGAVTSKVVSGLAAGTRYFLKCAAWNSTGEGPYSSTVNDTTLGNAPSPPPAPTGLYASAVTNNSIAWNWTASTGTHLSQQDLYLFNGSGCVGTFTEFSPATSAVSYATTSLKAGTLYSAYLTVTNASGTSADSNCASATTATTVISPFILLLGAESSTSSVELTWTAPSGIIIVNYTLYIGVIYGTYSQNFSEGTVLEVNVTGLATDQLYYFQIDSWTSATVQGPTSNVAPVWTGVTGGGPPPANPAPGFPLAFVITLGSVVVIGVIVVSMAAKTFRKRK